MAAVLEVDGLVKWLRHPWTFRRIPILHGLSLQIEEGEVFGLIGPNGAGKTTTFKLLLGLLQPSAGRIIFAGQPIDQRARGMMGFLPEQPYFYDYLTVTETLDLFARLHGLRNPDRRARVNEVIELLQLGHKRNARLRTLSKGLLQRVGFGQAIINRPRLAILDEPMSGLDPIGRHHVRETIASLHAHGTTVLFSSHILPDAEAICSRVGILVGGRLRDVVCLGSTESMAYVLTFRNVPATTLSTVESAAGGSVVANRNSWSVRVPNAATARTVMDIVWHNRGLVERLEPVSASLEERFLAHVGSARPLD